MICAQSSKNGKNCQKTLEHCYYYLIDLNIQIKLVSTKVHVLRNFFKLFVIHYWPVRKSIISQFTKVWCLNNTQSGRLGNNISFFIDIMCMCLFSLLEYFQILNDLVLILLSTFVSSIFLVLGNLNLAIFVWHFFDMIWIPFILQYFFCFVVVLKLKHSSSPFAYFDVKNMTSFWCYIL